MANITIHLNRVDGNDAIKKVEQAINEIGPGEQLTITMASFNAHHSDEVTDLLARNHFDYQPIGSHGNEEYIITARRTVKRI